MIRILLIDDEQAILDGIFLAFESTPWELRSALSGEEGIRVFYEEGPFDLVMTDKNLPDIDGVSLVKGIRAAFPDVRFVMMTGFASPASAIDSVNLGVDAYLEKPFRDLFELQFVVQAALDRERSAEQKHLAVSFALEDSEFEEEATMVAPDEPGVRVLVVGGERLIAATDAISRRVHKVTIVGEEDVTDEVMQRCDVVLTRDDTKVVRTLRQKNRAVPIVVVADQLGLGEAKAMLEAGATQLIDQTAQSEHFGIRLQNVLQRVLRSVSKSGPI